jgi:hypothetical protein
MTQAQYHVLSHKLDTLKEMFAASLARIEATAIETARRFPNDREVSIAVDQLITSALGEQEAA